MRIKYVILGLGALLVALITTGFIYLQFFLHEKNIVTSTQKNESYLSKSVQSTIFIEKINDYTLKGLHIETNKSLTKELKGMEAKDKNGYKMPLNQLKAGQIVSIQNKVITPVASVHVISDLTGIKIDLEKMIVKVGHIEYRLADSILAVDSLGKRLSLTDISPYDIVSLTIYQDKVWSITREKASARLILTNVPKDSGQIAINNSRLIQLKDTKEGIPITSGSHKIVVKMPGYIPLSIHIVVEEGESYTLSLSDAKLAYTTIKPQLNVSNYSVHINNKTYGPQDEIKLPQGQYTVTIRSSGYESWQSNLNLSKDIYLLRVNLTKLDTEETEVAALPDDYEETTDFLEDMIEEEETTTTETASAPVSTSTSNEASNSTSNNASNTTSTNASNTSSNTVSNNASSNTSSSASNNTSNNVSNTTPNTARTITLSTSPTGANIYKGDTLIGTSPFTTQLEDGTHEFTIQKDDYAPYHAKVMLDPTDEGGIYLYKLKKTEKTE